MGDELPAIDLGVGRLAKQVSAGYKTSCAVLDDSTVKCWGDNTSGKLGLGNTDARGNDMGEMGEALPPVDLGADSAVLSVSTYNFTVCALLSRGRVKCWGDNSFGQLGLGSTSTRGDQPGEMGAEPSVVDVGAGRHVLSVSVGSSIVCSVLDDGSIKCWGSNESGKLGIGETPSILDPTNRGDQSNEMGDALPAVQLW